MTSRRRPRHVTWLSLGVLTFSGWYLARLALGIDQPDIPLSVPRWYLPLTGAVWGASGSIAAYGLFRGLSWAPVLIRWGAVVFTVWYWSDRFFLVHSPYAGMTWPAALAITLLVLAGLYWLLSRPSTRSFFGEMNS